LIQRILVAYDGSKPSEKAFEFGLDIARKYGAEMIVLSVARPPEPAEVVETEAVLESAKEYYERHFAELREKASAAGVSPKFDVVVGHPAAQIVHAANDRGVDLVVMGHTGKSLVQRWLLGSVSKRVLSYAHCTVAVVR